MNASAALTTAWARAVMGALAESGVTRVIASPGSRSTPLLLAALEHPALDVLSVVDERSAGFFALGQAKLTGEPPVLLCTSGSAAANYFPAVVEASESRTPLIVLSADRPLELADLGAAQTIDQTRLFGDFARRFVELGVADDAPGAFEGLVRRVALAVEAARSPRPGPVQINARARKPLEPAAEFCGRADSAVASVPRVFAAERRADPKAIDALAEIVGSNERGVLVAGPMPAFAPRPRAATLARTLGYALLPEATSQLRFALDATDAPVIGYRELEAPVDVIVQLGRAPVSRRFASYLAAHPGAKLVIVCDDDLPDPEKRASLVVQGPVAEIVEALIERVPPRAGRSVEELRASEPVAGDGWSEALAVRRAVDALPPGGVLVLGNSLPVREVDAFCPPAAREIRVVASRGAAGIDGLVSTAAGASVASDRPTLLLVGDVSLLHDVGGLWAARHAKAPLVVMVLNNGGGRIFDELPIARELARDPRFGYWTTPQTFDLSHAAKLFELPHQRAASDAELCAALALAFERRGASVVEAALGAER